jgi:hypothetical protein
LSSTGTGTEGVGKATSARADLDVHIQSIEAAGKLTPEQADRLRVQLPAAAEVGKQTSDLRGFAAGLLVTLAVIGLAWAMVIRLSGTTPADIAGVLAAFAAVLAAIPPIVKTLRGH